MTNADAQAGASCHPRSPATSLVAVRPLGPIHVLTLHANPSSIGNRRRNANWQCLWCSAINFSSWSLTSLGIACRPLGPVDVRAIGAYPASRRRLGVFLARTGNKSWICTRDYASNQASQCMRVEAQHLHLHFSFCLRESTEALKILQACKRPVTSQSRRRFRGRRGGS